MAATSSSNPARQWRMVVSWDGARVKPDPILGPGRLGAKVAVRPGDPLAIGAWRDPGPCLEGPDEGGGLGVAQLFRDLRDGLACLLEPGQGQVSTQGVLDGAEARTFLGEAPVQGACRQLQAAR